MRHQPGKPALWNAAPQRQCQLQAIHANQAVTALDARGHMLRAGQRWLSPMGLVRQAAVQRESAFVHA